MWSAIRWQTYYLLLPHCDLKKNGINNPTGLMQFPWEKDEDVAPINAEDCEDLIGLMNDVNKQNENKKGNDLFDIIKKSSE